ncbi:hypothetical protein NPIL_208401 [Nephila pilipes]|uniref:Uncharacterized protein n=1 Tax=Nephila pilipes TaxID=299642 RepID=A0A8X6NL06_NEPPI|nr:hypothetical protein NPIL_208401 [Nephila pilipes]
MAAKYFFAPLFPLSAKAIDSTKKTARSLAFGELYWTFSLRCGRGEGWDWLEREETYLLKESRCRQSFAKKFGGAKSKRHGNRWAFAREGNKGANTNNGMQKESSCGSFEIRQNRSRKTMNVERSFGPMDWVSADLTKCVTISFIVNEIRSRR